MNPEALAAVVLELRREAASLHLNVNEFSLGSKKVLISVAGTLNRLTANRDRRKEAILVHSSVDDDQRNEQAMRKKKESFFGFFCMMFERDESTSGGTRPREGVVTLDFATANRPSLQTTTTTTTLTTSGVGGNRRRVFDAADLQARAGQSAQRRLGARTGCLGLGAASGTDAHVKRVDASLLHDGTTMAVRRSKKK